MKFWRRLTGILRKAPETAERSNSRETFLARYRSFHELLTQNSAVLEQMADMEGRTLGAPVDKGHMETDIMAIADGVKKIIDRLNFISKGAYCELNERFAKIDAEVQQFFENKVIPVSSYTIDFDEITADMSDRLGNKNANLGEARNRIGIPTPDGFAISAYAYKRFLDFNGLRERITSMLSELPADDRSVLEIKSGEIQELILTGKIPPDLEDEILRAYKRLCDRAGEEIRVSLRSSAIHEDGEFSFAGQYATFLDVPSDLLLTKYREVIASLFAPKALIYHRTRNLNALENAMAVGVLRMIDAMSAGVVYTTDPNRPKADILIISAVRGMGRCVVDGVMTPETYAVTRAPALSIVEKTVPERSIGLVCRADGGSDRVSLPEERGYEPFMKDEQIVTLAKYAIMIEKHYSSPRDIEWAVGMDEKLYILQTRPLFIPEEAAPVPSRIEGYKALIDKGVIASKGIGAGKAYVIGAGEDARDFPDGGVLVAKNTSTKYATVIGRARAIVTDIGGATVHMATLARESQVPMLVDTESATEVIKDGQEITVDAINGIVYEGNVKELSGYSGQRPAPRSPLVNKILRRVIRLNLINPEDETFRPERCETFHDIIRFAHQKAMQEMFKISDELPEDAETIRLSAGMPLGVLIIDLGGGIEEADKRNLHAGSVRSAPFKAFLNGMSSVAWPEPRHVDVKGFVGMMAHTASTPEAELEEMGEQSFCFISGEYMNFSIRLGYHLSVVEAFLGENITDNYIRFFFKGGGADVERRLRRVKLIRDILSMMDFNVKTFEDVIDAVTSKYKKAQLEQKLEVLGRMTVYTKQMDAVLFDEASAEEYFEEFVRKHLEAGIQR